MTRPAKKTETLELRIPPGVKQAFMEHCAADGRGASETVRMLIDGHLAQPVRAARRRLLRIAAAVTIAAGAGAVALPSLAAGAARTGYDSLDRNHDGSVSIAEMAALDANRDGRVTYPEYRAL